MGKSGPAGITDEIGRGMSTRRSFVKKLAGYECANGHRYWDRGQAEECDQSHHDKRPDGVHRDDCGYCAKARDYGDQVVTAVAQ